MNVTRCDKNTFKKLAFTKAADKRNSVVITKYVTGRFRFDLQRDGVSVVDRGVSYSPYEDISKSDVIDQLKKLCKANKVRFSSWRYLVNNAFKFAI